MQVSITRRVALLAGLAAAPAHAVTPRRAPAPPAKDAAAPPPSGDPTAELAALERRLGGRVGVAALDMGSGARIEYRADERFPLCSTYKFLLAASVLGRADRGDEDLNRRILFGKDDLVSFSPATRGRIDRDGMSVAELCEAALVVSDNTAANLLLSTLGGPAGLTAFAKTLGDDATRLDRPEPALNEAKADDPRDTTTPAAMLGSLRRVMLEPTLKTESRDRLAAWMFAGTTGVARLRAGLPKTWRVADKTGTGENGAAGDIAVIWPPDRAPLVVAVYLAGSKASLIQIDAAIAQAGRLVGALG